MSDRFTSYDEFWPFYIEEHTLPATRWVHFIGTTGYLAAFVVCVLTTPFTFVPAYTLAMVVGVIGFRREARVSSFVPLLAMIGLSMLGNPAILVGAVFAYGMAWVGHFKIEHNRPATFTYPLWSLASDFRMYGKMWQGKMWTGDGMDGR